MKELFVSLSEIRKVIYRLLLIFCIINLIPVAWYNFFGNNDFENLNGLAYIIMGKWEKGFNIFAVSSCVYLLFILYVMIILATAAADQYDPRAGETSKISGCIIILEQLYSSPYSSLCSF